MVTPDSAPAAEIDNMITNNGKGNEALCNLPRKINIALSPSRDDFPHTHINDVGLQAGKDPETGEVSVSLEGATVWNAGVGGGIGR